MIPAAHIRRDKVHTVRRQLPSSAQPIPLRQRQPPAPPWEVGCQPAPRLLLAGTQLATGWLRAVAGLFDGVIINVGDSDSYI